MISASGIPLQRGRVRMESRDLAKVGDSSKAPHSHTCQPVENPSLKPSDSGGRFFFFVSVASFVFQ